EIAEIRDVRPSSNVAFERLDLFRAHIDRRVVRYLRLAPQNIAQKCHVKSLLFRVGKGSAKPTRSLHLTKTPSPLREVRLFITMNIGGGVGRNVRPNTATRFGCSCSCLGE